MRISDAMTIALGHHRAGRLDVAEEIYRRILAAEPEHAEAQHLLGVAALGQGRPEEAIAAIQRAIALDGSQPAFHNNLGEAFRGSGRTQEAAACYHRACALNPAYASARYNLGLLCQEEGQLAQAVSHYRAALALEPDRPKAWHNLGMVQFELGRLSEAIGAFRRAVDLQPGFTTALNNWLCALRHDPRTTRASLAAAHGEYQRSQAAPLRATWRPYENLPDPERPLRLGFVAAQFTAGPVGSLLVRVLENLDPAQAQAFSYSGSPASDATAERVRAASRSWRDAAALDDESLAERIRADRIDILFDLAGHAPGNRLMVFARRPAPVQVTWIDSVGTTGLEAIDYLLADRWLVPPEAERDYVEKVLRMPDGYVCYDPPAQAPAPAAPPAFARGWVTFGSFHRAAKIGPEVVGAWAAILSRVPGARLLLKYRGFESPATQEHYRGLFARAGVEQARVEFEGHSPLAECFEAYGRVDVALDPFPHNGGLTTCDALWMGVPVVTLPGQKFAGRQSLSHLSNVGLTNLIAGDLEEYVRMAVGLAGDLPRLARLRSTLRAQAAASPLCDGKRFADHLLELLRVVWRAWCEQP